MNNISDRIIRSFYGNKWFLWHFVLSLTIAVAYFVVLKICDIDYNKTLSIICSDTISLSAAVAGFVFAGMSIFISMEGSKKMTTIKSVEKDNIIYSILISSIVFFVISLLLMGLALTVFNVSIEEISDKQIVVKSIIEWTSILSLLLGFVFFLSSVKLVYWIFK